MSIPDTREPRHIVHMTSAHSRFDIRIYHKQCVSLAKAGYRVTLIVADGKGNETTSQGIEIIDCGKPTGRLNRIVFSARRVGAAARKINADLYQFHDPELMFVGLSLKRRGKRVVFDSHEDVPKQMLGKPYLTPFLRRVMAGLIASLEKYACRRFDGVIGATPYITNKFRLFARRSENINNFPMLGELDTNLPWSSKQSEICYVGQIALIRGIVPLVQSLEYTSVPARLNLVGSFAESETEAAVRKQAGWGRVNALGHLDRPGVRDIMSRSMGGIVTFLPLPNHVDAQPNKMFEYMAAGIPVIASDFPLWREIIIGNDCGICVDPSDPHATAEAVDALVSNPARAKEMGENGKRAVSQKYNWGIEESRLISFYQELIA